MIKFELNEYHRNMSDEDLINDLKRVAKDLEKNAVTTEEYNKYGKYSSSCLRGRFGSWFKALEKAGLEKTRNLGLTEKELIDDLIRVAKDLGKSPTTFKYNDKGKFHNSTYEYRFGSWFKALEKAGLEKTRNYGITDEQYFKNIEEVWIKLGRQPKYLEIEKPLSKYSSGAYERRFGTWRKALERFIEYVNKEEAPKTEIEIPIVEVPDTPKDDSIKHKTKRNISWRLRFIVMHRDNFKCKRCGRSPASDPTIILHVDHHKAWSKGGETVLDNLETLCSVCNIGKSNLEI